MWVCAAFSNEPSKLSHFSGFVEGTRALGFAVAFGVDSNTVPFLTEAGTYFALLMIGLCCCAISASLYMSDSFYGKEETVIVPQSFDELVTSPSEKSVDTNLNTGFESEDTKERYQTVTGI